MKKIRIMTVFCCLLALFALSSAAEAGQHAYQAPLQEDFSGLTWSAAFDKLHVKFSCEYGFTDWKQIDWAALYQQYKPRIEQAQNSNDFTAYYITLKEYVHSIPDGHVRIDSIPDIDNRYIGGGFGFSAVRLSDGKVIAFWVDESGAAYALGMRAGAELIEWNGRPVQAVLNDISPIFYYNSATAEDLANQKTRYLTRAPINTKISLSFANPGGGIMKVSLIASDDNGKSLTQTYPATVVSDGLRDLILGVENPKDPPTSMVEKKILDGNIGYLKLWGELDVDFQETGKAPSTLGLFRTALEEFNQKKVKGLIIDIRNNVGGLDSMVADMLGSFYTVKTLYEYANGFNTLTGAWEICTQDLRGSDAPDPGLYIEPAQPFFRGPVVALVNSRCISSGEGLALGIKNLPNGQTVGFYGTNGSFGLAGDEARMPGDIVIHWPFGQSLDKNKQVQIDSRNGIGGVSPSIRTPMTLENALRAARGEDVELEQAVEVIKNYN